MQHETAAISLGAFCVHHTTMHHVSHFMQSHILKVHAYLAVTCHLRFWQNDRDLLRATAVTRGWNGPRNNSQHSKQPIHSPVFTDAPPPRRSRVRPSRMQYGCSSSLRKVTIKTRLSAGTTISPVPTLTPQRQPSTEEKPGYFVEFRVADGGSSPEHIMTHVQRCDRRSIDAVKAATAEN